MREIQKENIVIYKYTCIYGYIYIKKCEELKPIKDYKLYSFFLVLINCFLFDVILNYVFQTKLLQ